MNWYGVEVYENQEPLAMSPGRGYHEGDQLEEVYSYRFYVYNMPSDENICEGAFRELNRDDRPTATYARSTSVGDVITIFKANNPAVSYAIESVGFRKLDQVHFWEGWKTGHSKDVWVPSEVPADDNVWGYPKDQGE